MNTQPHYSLDYGAMELSFDLGNNGLVYNVAKYLTRDKGTTLEDYGKACDLLRSYLQWHRTSPGTKRLTGCSVEPQGLTCIRKFANQFDRSQRLSIYYILTSIVSDNIVDALLELEESINIAQWSTSFAQGEQQ